MVSIDDNDEVGGNYFDNMMQKKKAENSRFRYRTKNKDTSLL